jgi:hypothetical protein
MTVPPEVEAQILRLHHVEKWRRGTIARQLHVHYDTVTRCWPKPVCPEPIRRNAARRSIRTCR